MFIINRYIRNEIWQRFLWITGLLCLIYLSTKFIDLLSLISASKISSILLLKMLGLKLLSTLPKLLSATVFLAIILSYSKLNSDNEIIIMYVAGISKLEQLKIVLSTSLPIYLFVASLVFFISPWAESEYSKLNYQLSQNTEIAGIVAGQFNALNKGKYIIYVESISNDQNMGNVFLYIKHSDKLSILSSQSARLAFDQASGKRHIKFADGQHYVSTFGELDYRITEYESYAITLAPEEAIANVNKKNRSLPTSALLFSHQAKQQAELQWRISLVLSCVLLSLLGVLLSQSALSKKRLALILVSILLYFIYNDLLGTSKSLLSHGTIPATVGLWWVHILLIITLLTLYHAPKMRHWLKPKKQTADR